MDYVEFKEEMKNRIKEFLPEKFRDYSVDVILLRKNNGVIEDGLTVRGREQAVPALNLNDFYEAYKDGASLKSILEQAAEVYKMNLETCQGFGTQMLQYEKAKEYLTVTVCSADKNEELLKRVPHERREDLALIYRMGQPISDQGWGNTVVNHAMLKHWNVGEEELKAEAWKRMKINSAPVFSSIETVIKNILKDSSRIGVEMGGEPFAPLYVLTNKEGVWGAAYMFDRETMADIAEKLDSSLIILPSSIHEVLLLPESADICIPELQDMVKLINQSEVEEQDVLSDSVYRFDREEQTLTMFQPVDQAQGMSLRF